MERIFLPHLFTLTNIVCIFCSEHLDQHWCKVQRGQTIKGMCNELTTLSKISTCIVTHWLCLKLPHNYWLQNIRLTVFFSFLFVIILSYDSKIWRDFFFLIIISRHDVSYVSVSWYTQQLICICYGPAAYSRIQTRS